MNIFYLASDAEECAEMHCDRHVVKMLLEYSQILSTAHRYLEGIAEQKLSDSGRKKTVYSLSDSRESFLYAATHINHPSTVWARASYENYEWLYLMLYHLSEEYTHRYGKTHAIVRDGVMNALYYPPKTLEKNRYVKRFTEPTPAMPDKYKVRNDSIQSYRNYYIHEKASFATWKNREVPDWFKS